MRRVTDNEIYRKVIDHVKLNNMKNDPFVIAGIGFLYALLESIPTLTEEELKRSIKSWDELLIVLKANGYEEYPPYVKSWMFHHDEVFKKQMSFLSAFFSNSE